MIAGVEEEEFQEGATETGFGDVTSEHAGGDHGDVALEEDTF